MERAILTFLDHYNLAWHKVYLTESVHNVVLQKSIPTRIRQLILYYYLCKESVDLLVRELTLAKRRYEHFL